MLTIFALEESRIENNRLTIAPQQVRGHQDFQDVSTITDGFTRYKYIYLTQIKREAGDTT